MASDLSSREQVIDIAQGMQFTSYEAQTHQLKYLNSWGGNGFQAFRRKFSDKALVTRVCMSYNLLEEILWKYQDKMDNTQRSMQSSKLGIAHPMGTNTETCTTHPVPQKQIEIFSHAGSCSISHGVTQCRSGSRTLGLR